MKIKQFRYSSDNLGYVLYTKNQAVAIDGGAVEEIMGFLDKNNLKLQYVTNTHTHPDHTMGTHSLVQKTGAGFLDNKTIRESPAICLENHSIQVIHTPGHTGDSVTFYTGDALITGDTLFVGTVGNCFSGNMKGYFQSLKKLLAYPPDTYVYPGHDYVEYAMSAAKEINTSNPDIDAFWETYDPEFIRSTIGLELKINPFVRYNDDSLKDILLEKKLPVATEFERWTSLMSMH